MDTGFKFKYVNAVVDSMMKINTNLDRDDVKKFVIDKLKKSMKNPTIVMDNNVTHENFKTNLVDLCKWIDTNKPVVSGNATFYCQPDKLKSPTTTMLRALKKLRSNIKKELWKVESGSDEAKRLDLMQLLIKIIMNAEYGASGAITSAFYTKYSPAATTMMAQSIITIMAAFFEGFIGDNQKFFHIDECIDWMNSIICKNDDIPKWTIIPHKDDVKRRIKLHFYQYNIIDDNIINNYIDNCNDRELSYLYYANNIKDLIRNHDKIKQKIYDVLTKLPILEASTNIPDKYKDKFNKVKDYNDWVSEEMFLNPYNTPSIISDDMKWITDIIYQMCYVDYITPDSIIKLNNHKRNTIILVDTDSNIIHANIFVKFILDEIFPNETFGRSNEYNELICISMITSIMTKPMSQIFELYGIQHFADKDARSELSMKNEMVMKRFILFNKKKRYAALKTSREGHILIPYETEIKGIDFIKSGLSEKVSNRFTSMLEEYVLFSDKLNLHGLMKELRQFESEIYESLNKGYTEYLKPFQYKEGSAYKNPWSTQVYRATALWNAMYPDNQIFSLDSVNLVKLDAITINDFNIIKEKYPDDYDRILSALDTLENDKKVYFVNSTQKIPSTILNIIAVPSNVKILPEWIRELIDYQTIISDTVNSFRSVLNAFRIVEPKIKTKNGSIIVTTPLIQL